LHVDWLELFTQNFSQLLSQRLHFDQSIIGWNFSHIIVLNFYLKAGFMISLCVSNLNSLFITSNSNLTLRSVLFNFEFVQCCYTFKFLQCFKLFSKAFQTLKLVSLNTSFSFFLSLFAPFQAFNSKLFKFRL
jgi:hypothetical protein